MRMKELMEAPCQCDCGEWFDLEDGYRSQGRDNIVICGACNRAETEEEDRINEMLAAVYDLEEGNTSFKTVVEFLRSEGVSKEHLKSKASISAWALNLEQ